MRELLGNIKGPQGERGLQGVKGDPGDITAVDSGIMNLINLSTMQTYQDLGELSFDIESGIVSYTNISYYVRSLSKLGGKVYSFKIKDYQRQKGYNGLLNLRLVSMENVSLFSSNVDKNEVIEIDLTGYALQDVWIEFRTTGVDKVDGYIEKPVLVESDYPVAWYPSNIDLSVLIDTIKPYYDIRHFTRDLLAGVNTTLTTFNRGSNQVPTDTAGDIVLNQGTWLITWSSFIIMNATGTVTTRIEQDGVDVFRETSSQFYRNTSLIVNVIADQSVFKFKILNNGDATVEMSPDIRNSTQIKKL